MWLNIFLGCRDLQFFARRFASFQSKRLLCNYWIINNNYLFQTFKIAVTLTYKRQESVCITIFTKIITKDCPPIYIVRTVFIYFPCTSYQACNWSGTRNSFTMARKSWECTALDRDERILFIEATPASLSYNTATIICFLSFELKHKTCLL